MKNSIKLLVILTLISSTSFAHDCGRDIETKIDDNNVLVIKEGELHKQLLILMNLGMMSKNQDGELELNQEANSLMDELERRGLVEDILVRRSTICI